MKTTILKLCMVFLMIPIMTSCSKDDDGTSAPVYPEENFLESYLTATGFNQVSATFINSIDYEFGLDFTPLVKGDITSFRVKLPDANTSLRVTIWDKDASTVIKTEVVNVSTADTEFTFDIVDVPLVKDKKYSITMNSNDWFDRRKTDGTVAAYPVTAGNIKIDGYRWDSGAAQSFPAIVASDYYAGDLSFNFRQTE